MPFNVSGKTVAITGVCGFIGRHLARRCLSLGANVRGLDTTDSGSFQPNEAEIDVLVGDVTNCDDAKQLCCGADVVIHTAAVVREGGDPELFQRVNVGGTRTVVEAAKAAGVQRFVQISSVMVYGFNFPDQVDESAELRGEGNPYCETKIESERVAIDLHEPGGMEVIVIRCGDVYGPGSMPWTVRPVQMMKSFQFVLVDGGRGIMNHVFIDNLTDGIILALQSDHTGEAFNISDGVGTTFREFFGYYSRMIGWRPLMSLPGFLVRPGIVATNSVFRLLGIPPQVYPDFVNFVSRTNTYSVQKAADKLGYAPSVNLDEGMRRTSQWLVEQQMIRR